VPRIASYTVAFSLQLRKKHGKISARVKKNLSQVKKNISHSTKTSVTVQKPQSQYKNLSHSTKTSVTVQKPQSQYTQPERLMHLVG
jgi:hypothetical protein